MANERVQWHPAFQAVMRIELEEELDNLDIRDEQLLNKKPLQMDMLVIKKKDDIPIKKNIGRIFKKHNVVEYKSPTDYFGINDFYKVYGYACLYQSNTEHELEIDPDEITITFVSTKYPRKMMNYLKKKLKLQIEYVEPGIYYIKGDRFTMQLIVSSKLSKESNFWLQSLRDDIQDMKEIEEIAERYNDRRSSGWYQAVMNVITHANWEKMEEKKMMCEALRELFADELAEAEKAKKEAVEKAEKAAREAVKKAAKEAAREAAKEAAKKAAKEIALTKKAFKLERAGLSIEQIATQCETTVATVQEILA